MRWCALTLILLGMAYGATGVYTVGTDQRALVRRFGRVISEESSPGLHFGLPWGLDRVDLLKPSETKTVTVGLTSSADGFLTPSRSDTLAQFMTGDQNLVNVQATVQFTLRDAKQYLFSAGDPARIVSRASESAITATLADQSVDTVLTTGKSALATLIRDRLQQRLDGYGLGVEVRSVNLVELAPPPQLADAFTRASSASSDRKRLELEAVSYENERLAQARGEAQQILDKARADHDRSIDLARSDAERFAKLLYEYQKAPAITITRLYLETMSEVIPRFRSRIIVDSGKDVDIMIMREEPK
jgi:membrane protease subunit HflK